MSEYLVAPEGATLFAHWACCVCVARGARIGMTADEARDEGAAHVRATGHAVGVERGTRTVLIGMAMETASCAPGRDCGPGCECR